MTLSKETKESLSKLKQSLNGMNSEELSIEEVGELLIEIKHVHTELYTEWRKANRNQLTQFTA